MTADGSDRSFGAPRFDVVLRGYDRRQVDEHLARLQRLVVRMRSDLDAARSQLGPPPPGGRQRPTPRPRPDGPPPPTGANDLVGTFTDRMHAILQSAEEEAAAIRNKARAAVRADEERAARLRAAVRAEEDAARRTLADLVGQRDAVLAELTRVRGQLEGLLSGPTARIIVPTQESGPQRREVGAGQPLPGTPDLFEPATKGEPGAVTTTDEASTEAPDEPDAADGAAPAAPPEQTLLMEPVTGEPAAEAVPVESTQAVAAPVGGPATHDQDADDSTPAPVDAPTQAAPASPARSG